MDKDKTMIDLLMNKSSVYDMRRDLWKSLDDLQTSVNKDVLDFMNLIFDTNYKNLISFKIYDDDLPSKKHVLKIIKENKKLAKKINISIDIDFKIIDFLNNVLKKVNFYFVEHYDNDDNKYYKIKSAF
jgi:hypothetical protein